MKESNQRGYVVVLALCTTALILGTLTYFYFEFEESRRIRLFGATFYVLLNVLRKHGWICNLLFGKETILIDGNFQNSFNLYSYRTCLFRSVHNFSCFVLCSPRNDSSQHNGIVHLKVMTIINLCRKGHCNWISYKNLQIFQLTFMKLPLWCCSNWNGRQLPNSNDENETLKSKNVSQLSIF